jgi:hypothetical protein
MVASVDPKFGELEVSCAVPAGRMPSTAGQEGLQRHFLISSQWLIGHGVVTNMEVAAAHGAAEYWKAMRSGKLQATLVWP